MLEGLCKLGMTMKGKGKGKGKGNWALLRGRGNGILEGKESKGMGG